MTQSAPQASKQRINVFGQFFASFLGLIMLPSILASSFTYFYVVGLVEREMEQASDTVVGHFAARTDELMEALQNHMIAQLGKSELPRLLLDLEGQGDPENRIDLLKSLTDQVSESAPYQSLAKDAYLYLANHDIVISSAGHFSKAVFFNYFNDIEGYSAETIDALFNGKKMMALSNPQTISLRDLYTGAERSAGRYISATISYPFNSRKPEAYLVMNIDAEQLRQQIHIDASNNAFEAALVNYAGQVLAYTGQGEIDGQVLLRATNSEESEQPRIAAGHRNWRMLSYYSGQFDWVYVGLADERELLRPGILIQRASALLLGFLLLVGVGLSYLLSKKLYRPIRDIKRQLEPRAKPRREAAGNEFDLIKEWSRTLVTEHREMAELIEGISPVMHEYFLSKVLLGEFRDGLSVEYYAREVGFDTAFADTLAVLCIELRYRGDPERPLTETDKTFLMTELKHRIERRLEGQVWLCEIRKELLACVIALPQEMETVAVDVRVGAVMDILSQQRANYRAAAALGCSVAAVSELHRSYRHALSKLKYQRFDEAVQLCEELDEPRGIDGFLPAGQVKQFLNLYKSGSFQSMVDHVNEWLDEARAGGATADIVRQRSTDILNTWLRAVSADGNHEFSIEQYASLFRRLHDSATWDELRLFFRDAAAELFKREHLEDKHGRFDQVADYIRTHYGSDLTIEQLAGQMGMSIGHFSRSFKEEMGEKYIDYVTRCRIEAAKQLLLETDMKLDEIAVRIGYWGRNPFIKMFRKYAGVTPGKYREAHKSS
ncbi:AraC family transcriptional regulator [Paenibacillus sp. IB182496]|uniref:AraC family transcriptional regulator n=1 Tax=Paenibacillus sabuli TaxID=2772509 RepID=A0A927BXC0_9BACL|nr:helix-turn-helix domain-containing protein [Paenibacillus sabuli]MBD2847445.1 AraC family transcriptional regulator [Paenibacillus sabuli]